LLLDYFAKDSQIVFKAHPKDVYFKYDDVIKNAFVIRRNLPSELLPFMFTKMLKRVITASSTSIGGVSMVAEESYSFSTDIEVNYAYLHVANAIARLIKEVEEKRNIIINLKEDSYLQNFMKLYKICQSEEISYENSIFIETDGVPKSYNEVALDKIKDQDMVIFDNYQNRFEFLLRYPNLDSQNLLCWKLEIKNKKGNYIDAVKQLWMYCKDEQVRQKMKNISFIEHLKYSDKEVSMKPEEVNELFIMKGKMRALEYALDNRTKKEKVIADIRETLDKFEEKEEQSEKFLLREGILDYRN